MSIRLSREAIWAFEERHALTQNQRPDAIEIGAFSQPPIQERGSAFKKAEPIASWQRSQGNGFTDPEPRKVAIPSPAVQLAVIVELALHLTRCKTGPYRVRREQLSSSVDRTYAPRSQWEFAFDVLDLWHSNRYQWPSVLAREAVLHPAGRALIKIAAKVFENNLLPKAISREEYDTLTDQQLQRNLIAQRLKEWFTLPPNANLVKLWHAKHNDSKKEFLESWGTQLQQGNWQVVRADLLYPKVPHVISGFGPLPHLTVREHVQRFTAIVLNDSQLSACKCLVAPYADFWSGWQLPMVALVPIHETPTLNEQARMLEHWRSATNDPGANMLSYFLQMKGDYRFISAEQNMYDSADAHLVRAATYFFDTCLIADTRIETVSSSNASEQCEIQVPRPAKGDNRMHSSHDPAGAFTK